MSNLTHIDAVLLETARIKKFAEAHSYDDYITVYSSLSKDIQHDVCTLLRHRSGGAWSAVLNNASTIQILFKDI